MSIHKTKNGTYRVRWRIGEKIKSRNFNKKVDATKFELDLRNNFDLYSATKEITFGDFAVEWLERYSAVTKSFSSQVEDRYVINEHFLPAWKRKKLDEISSRDVEMLRSEICRSKRKPKTVNNYFRILNRMFVLAMRWGYRSSNPCATIEPLKIHQVEMSFWTFAELDRVLEYARGVDKKLFDVVAFSAYTGLRAGEISGLLRDCLDFERKEIVVTRSFCTRRKMLVERTKGFKARRVPMNSVVESILKERSLVPPNERVFADFNNSNFISRNLRPAIKATGVSPIRFHDLRHTFGSHLAMLGVPIIKIKELMGHSDVKVTMRYMHLAPNELQGCTDILLRKQADPQVGNLAVKMKTV